MKRLGIYSLITLFTFCTSREENKMNNKTSPLIVNTYTIRRYDSLFPNLDNQLCPIYDIGISIINKGETTNSFWIMKCSWQDNFIISDDYFNFIVNECDGNFPTVKSIKPNDSLTYKTTIYSKSIDYVKTRDSIKLGIILIDEKKFSTSEDYLNIMRDKSLQTTVLWSNRINL
jgi:hypothetical protein